MLRFILSFLLLPILLWGEEPVLILNAPNVEALPRNFRTCNDPFKANLSLSRQGLNSLLISGSAQFAELELKQAIKKINYTNGPLIIVDLRQESHGFINGIAVSWFMTDNAINRGKTSLEIKQAEQKLLEGLKTLKEVKITKILSKSGQAQIENVSTAIEQVQTVFDEEALVKKFKAGYFRIYVPDHQAPGNAHVDEFLLFVKQLKPNTWLHFHCEAGKGRTTAFMCMYDMMRNAKTVSFDEIIRRQGALHPSNYKILKLKSIGHPDYASNIARSAFLREFYDYAKGNTDNFQTSWKNYKSKKTASVL